MLVHKLCDLGRHNLCMGNIAMWFVCCGQVPRCPGSALLAASAAGDREVVCCTRHRWVGDGIEQGFMDFVV